MALNKLCGLEERCAESSFLFLPILRHVHAADRSRRSRRDTKSREILHRIANQIGY